MKTINVYHYDAFSGVPDKGNPAGVVLGADSLSNIDMQKIAYSVGFNETVFVLSSTIADIKLKYYTPGHEINLCGHATMASLYCLKTRGMLPNKQTINIETNVGILPIKFGVNESRLTIEMKQCNPSFSPFNGDIERLAASIGLKSEDIDPTMPIVYGSTGTWTLLIPIRKLSSFKNMIPNNKLFPDILLENPRASVHPFCFETYAEEAFMHARHFSSPFSGTIEDPITGTASGVMGAYYLAFIKSEIDSIDFIVEQGQEIDKEGRVYVHAIKNEQGMDISIMGTAVFVKELIILYDLSE